jgi:hypothetical protein
MQETRGGISRGEACATSLEMVWTYPTEVRGGTDSLWDNKMNQ